MMIAAHVLQRNPLDRSLVERHGPGVLRLIWLRLHALVEFALDSVYKRHAVRRHSFMPGMTLTNSIAFRCLVVSTGAAADDHSDVTEPELNLQRC
jgi:hypothetical protein